MAGAGDQQAIAAAEGEPMVRLKVRLSADGSLTQEKQGEGAAAPGPLDLPGLDTPGPELGPELDPEHGPAPGAALIGEFASGISDGGPEVLLGAEPPGEGKAEGPGSEAAPQESARERHTSTERVTPEDEVVFRYRVRPGDALEISIPYEEGTGRHVPVQPDGYIRYLFDIEILAAGKTYAEIHDALLEKLKRYYRNPHVTVIGANFKGNSVFVMGPVANPGEHVINHGTRLLNVLSAAGLLGELDRREYFYDVGRRRESIDLAGAYVAREDRILEVDFLKLLVDRDLRNNNILMQPGDFIYIPGAVGAQNKVFICGEVGSPQVYYFSGTLTFMEAVLHAGGVQAGSSGSSSAAGSGASDTALARQCQIWRKGEKEPLIADWQRIQSTASPDIRLENGDIIFVPERPLASGSRKITRVISEIIAPLQAILNLDSTGKDLHRRDWGPSK